MGPGDLVDTVQEQLSLGRPQGVMSNYPCAYCHGIVRPRQVEREAFKHKDGFVILEHVIIGVCDVCGNRYYSADLLHAVHDVAAGRRLPERTEQVPVAHLTPVADRA